MNTRIMLATTAAACTLLATSAYAGSPYYETDAAPRATTHRAQAAVPADSEYRATAPESALGTAASAPAAAAEATTSSILGADGYPRVEPTPQYYNHAQGTMGAP